MPLPPRRRDWRAYVVYLLNSIVLQECLGRLCGGFQACLGICNLSRGGGFAAERSGRLSYASAARPIVLCHP